jgi:hydroxyacylglutathione hydrolase
MPTPLDFCPEQHAAVITVPAFSDNYLWLIRSTDERQAAVVDPGDAAPIEAALRAAGLTLSAILLTHHHRDHAGGVMALKAAWNCPVYGPRGESIEGVDHPLDDGDRVVLDAPGLQFDVLAVPGHTRGHIAYFSDRLGADPRPALFCGDTLFAGGCGRLFEGTPAQMLVSLGRLAALPDDSLVYCAHEYTLSNLKFACAVEPENGALAERLRQALARRAQGLATVPAQIGGERATNPFLRAGEPGVQAAATARLGHAPATEVDCFAAIREWKNVFQ